SRHTRFSRDWSSDVCSSDLGLAEISGAGNGGFGVSSFGLSTFEDTNGDGVPDVRMPNLFGGAAPDGITAGIIQGDDFSLPVLVKIGRASCREKSSNSVTRRR